MHEICPNMSKFLPFSTVKMTARCQSRFYMRSMYCCGGWPLLTQYLVTFPVGKAKHHNIYEKFFGYPKHFVFLTYKHRAYWTASFDIQKKKKIFLKSKNLSEIPTRYSSPTSRDCEIKGQAHWAHRVCC